MQFLSRETRQHFNLTGDPFMNDITSKGDVYLSSEHRYIHEALYQTAIHGGLLAVVGESGSGKSTMRRSFIDKVMSEGHKILVIQPKLHDKTRLNASHICEAIIRTLDEHTPIKQSLEAKSMQVEKMLSISSRAGNKHVLIIEEAHDLTKPALKYLKRFWEMEDGFTRLLGIILIGQPELKRKLDANVNYDAREIINRMELAELKPFSTLGDITAYLDKKMARVGGSAKSLFTDDGLDAVLKHFQRATHTGAVISTAYPLLLNNMVRTLLSTASTMGVDKIDKKLVSIA